MCFDAVGPSAPSNKPDDRTSEEVMCAMMKVDLGVDINPQAWRLFLRLRWERFAPLAHRIHDGKR